MANTAMVEMIARYYGMKAQTPQIRLTSQRATLISQALERVNEDVNAVKEHINEFTAIHQDCGSSNVDIRIKRFNTCFESVTPAAAPAPTPAAAPISTQEPAITDGQVQYSMGILEQAVIQLISKTQTERIENEIMGNVETTIRDFIQREYGAIERKITTVVDGKKVEMDGVVHEKFDTVLKFVANNIPVMLTGPAGSGKNVLCKQIAKALGLKFYFTNAVTQEYKLTGFTDANGNYQATQFYKAFTEGGIFMLDEMDASIPEVLVILNAAIANRYFDFPAPIGYVEAHPDFRVIAAGNTIGNGADFQYVGRNQLDAASLDRFAVIEIDYSPAIESSVTNGDAELVNFCRAFRNEAKKAGCMVIVSYRAMGRLAKMLQVLDIEEALRTCLVKGLEKDSVRMITVALPPSKYKTALENIARAA